MSCEYDCRERECDGENPNCNYTFWKRLGHQWAAIPLFSIPKYILKRVLDAGAAPVFLSITIITAASLPASRELLQESINKIRTTYDRRYVTISTEDHYLYYACSSASPVLEYEPAGWRDGLDSCPIGQLHADEFMMFSGRSFMDRLTALDGGNWRQLQSRKEGGNLIDNVHVQKISFSTQSMDTRCRAALADLMQRCEVECCQPEAIYRLKATRSIEVDRTRIAEKLPSTR